MIAMRCRVANFEDMFLAGLLHDVGIVLEDQHVHDAFAEMIGSLEEGNDALRGGRRPPGIRPHDAGRGRHRNWSFPETVTAAVRFHHDSAGCGGLHLQVVRFVEVANFICTVKGISSVGVNLVRFPSEAIEGLALTKEDVVVLVTDLDREISANESLFQL